MNRKLLFEEIKRISEIMKVSPKLINEQPEEALERAAEDAWSAFRNMFSRSAGETAERALDREISDLRRLMTTEEERLFDNVVNPIREPSAKSSAVESFISKNPSVLNSIIKELELQGRGEVSAILGKTVNSDAFRNFLDPYYASSLERNGGDIAAAQNQIRTFFKDELPNVFIEKYFENSTPKELPNGNWQIREKIPDPIPDPISDPDIEPVEIQQGSDPNEAWNIEFENIRKLTQSEINKLERLNRGFKGKLLKIRKFIIDAFGNETTLINETTSLIKTLTTNTNPVERTNLLKRINDNLISLSQKRKDTYSYINNWMDKNIYSVDRKILQDIRNTRGYKVSGSLFDGTAKAEWIKAYGGMRQRRSDLLENLRGFFNPFRWRGDWLKSTAGGSQIERWNQIIGRSQNLKGNAEWEKLRNDFKWGATLSPSQVAEYSRTFGIPKAIGLVTKEWVYSAVVFAGVSAITNLITDIIGMMAIKMKYPKDWVFYQSLFNNALSYELHLGGIDPSKDESYFNKILEIAGPISLYWWEELKTVSGFIPGGWDDITRLGIDFTHSFMYLNVSGKNITPEQIERIQKQGSILLTDIENAVDKVTVEFNKEMSEFEKMTDVDRNTPAGFIRWIKLRNLENKLPGRERKEDLKIFGREEKQSDWWTEKEKAKDGIPFGTTSDGKNWAFSLVQTPHTFIECDDCAKLETPEPPTPEPTDSTTTPPTPQPSAGLTVDSIIEKYPCYLKDNKGQQSSDKNFGDRGFEIVNDKQFKYKFINDTEIYTVNLGEDGVWKFEDGTALSC